MDQRTVISLMHKYTIQGKQKLHATTDISNAPYKEIPYTDKFLIRKFLVNKNVFEK